MTVNSEARQRPPSTMSSSLIVSLTRHSVVTDRAFPVAAARIPGTSARHLVILSTSLQRTSDDLVLLTLLLMTVKRSRSDS